jgi:hypothetical protein
VAKIVSLLAHAPAHNEDRRVKTLAPCGRGFFVLVGATLAQAIWPRYARRNTKWSEMDSALREQTNHAGDASSEPD